MQTKHPGNGTQHIFEDAPDVLYASLHRWDGGAFYPGTGAPSEVGWGAGRGFTVNVAWDGPGATDGDYELAMRAVLLPVLRAYAPDLVIISAGFDAAAGDPIGGCRLTAAAFARMTAQLAEVAPAALLLEGGYNLSATAEATEACVRVLMGDAPPPPPPAGAGREVTLAGWRGVQAALAVQARFWPCLAEAGAPVAPPHIVEAIRLQQELERRRREAAEAAAAAERRAAREAAERAAAAAALRAAGGPGGARSPAPSLPRSHSSQALLRAAARSREQTPAEERPWSSRYRRPSFSAAAEARLHMLRAGLSRKQQLLRHLHRRALRLALRRRQAVSQRREAGPSAGGAAPAAAAQAVAAAQPAPPPPPPPAAQAAGTAPAGDADMAPPAAGNA